MDGRLFPWGNEIDPSWCCLRESHADRPKPVSIYSYPDDESPYGIRGFGGNALGWCLDAFIDRPGMKWDAQRYVPPFEEAEAFSQGLSDPSTAHQPTEARSLFRTLRGGSWFAGRTRARCANRGG